MRTHLKKHKAVKKKVFYFYQNNTPMHLVFQSMYVVFDLAKKMFKDYCPPPPRYTPSGDGTRPLSTNF